MKNKNKNKKQQKRTTEWMKIIQIECEKELSKQWERIENKARQTIDMHDTTQRNTKQFQFPYTVLKWKTSKHTHTPNIGTLSFF